jgi:hypothetical protein
MPSVRSSAGSLQRGDATCLSVRHGDLEQGGRDELRDVEIAVRTKRDAVKADAILGRCQKRIGRPDLERGAIRVEAIHIWRERVGRISGAVGAYGDVVAHGLHIVECEAALGHAGVKIEGFQLGTLGVGGPGTQIPVISLEQAYKVPLCSSASTPSTERLAAAPGGMNCSAFPSGATFITPQD